jgi:circadian clock protein KaiC
MTVDEFTARLQQRVEEGATLVTIDGVAGFERAFAADAEDPIDALVAVARYLRNVGVTGLFTNEVHRITGDFYATEQRVSHLADDIVVFRHVEYRGELQKVVGVLKRRTSAVDTGLRLFEITGDGIVVGEPRSELRGILTGTPDWHDDG